ncbi:tetratricopeptide repeat protein [bacterium]|nr:tetratricopeptide repeat protein [bacterium]
MNDSWDNPEESGFLKALTQRWSAWREHRRILAAERRELRRFEKEEKQTRDGMPAQSRDMPKPSARSYGSAETQSDNETVVSRVRVLPEDRTTGFDAPPGEGGLFAQWREAARMRQEIRKERKAIEGELRKGFANPKRLDGPDDEFAVGGTRHGAADQDENLKFSFSRLISTLWSELIYLRVPQWLAAIVPSIVFLLTAVIPAVTNTTASAATQRLKYSAKWQELVKSETWKAAELCGTRLLESGPFNVDDDFRYFDCLMKTGNEEKAVRFLLSRESQVRSADLAKYRYRLAEQLFKLPDFSRRPGLRNLAFGKLRESTAGPLPEKDEEKARQMLANVAIIQGNFDAAEAYLEPIASRSPFIAADLLFLKFNRASDDELGQIRSAASGLLVNIDTGRPVESLGELSALRARMRLLMILDREKEARSWLGKVENLSVEDRKGIALELEKLSLLTEGRKKPVKAEVLWARLQPLLESEPNNQAWLRLALGIWARDERKPGSPLDRWVRERLQSDSADIEFLRQGSMAAHMNGRWDDSRAFYRKVLERQPNDVSALNNLSGLLYKFPPRDLEESLRLVDKALELAPRNLVILETKGQILARMGKFDEAREILVSTIPALPREWNLHNTLAQIYERQGDTRNAAAHRNILSTLPKPTDADRYAVLADFVKDTPKNAAQGGRR